MSEPFRIHKYEVWQDLYSAVMGRNPSRWPGPRNSAEQMSWQDAQEFCRRATARLRERKLIAADEVVRLPTETEWEYCCRAGTTTDYSFGAEPIGQYAWYAGNAAGNDPVVGALRPNAWGFYDMHGYLWELCHDDWRDPRKQGSAPAAACVIRGGSWRDPAERLTSAARQSFDKTAVSDAVGFRCVISRERAHGR